MATELSYRSAGLAVLFWYLCLLMKEKKKKTATTLYNITNRAGLLDNMAWEVLDNLFTS
jgi:hypothetical protein